MKKPELHEPELTIEAPEPPSAPLPGTIVYFLYSDRETYPALIQGYERDGAARLWVFACMSVYRHTAIEGTVLGMWNRAFIPPTRNNTNPPEVLG